MQAGRPEIYTEELAIRVLARIAEGISVRTICKGDDMPSMTTFFKWLRENDQFAQQYAIAKEQSTDALFEDLIDIADNEVAQQLIIEGKPVVDEYGKPVMVKDNVSVNHAKLRVDTRKWALSKMAPKKYGDKIQPDDSGQIDMAAALKALAEKLPS